MAVPEQQDEVVIGSQIDRIEALEDTYYEFTFWREISSGTSGTIAKPVGSEILLNRWPNDIDAVVSPVVTGKVPDEEYVYTSAGAIVTTTFDATGAYNFSGAPSSYPVAIIGRARVPLSGLSAILASEELLDYTKIDNNSLAEKLFIPAGAMVPATTNPAESGTNEYGTNDQDFDYFAFDSGATEERVEFPVVLPYWNGGTITAIPFWTSATGSSVDDTVEWGVKGVAIGDSDPLDVAQGAAQVISDAITAANGADLQIASATPAITIGGSGSASDLINMEIYRNTDGTDDMAEDAWLLGVLLVYRKDLPQ